MLIRRLLIRGTVQGVGYRASMVRAAMDLGVTGWVRNRQDGMVEALVRASPADLDALVRWAQQGPPGAFVSGLRVSEVDDVQALSPADALPDHGFEQRPTV